MGRAWENNREEGRGGEAVDNCWIVEGNEGEEGRQLIIAGEWKEGKKDCCCRSRGKDVGMPMLGLVRA